MSSSPALLSRPRRLIALSSIAVLVASTLTVPQAAQASQVPSGDRPVNATKAESVRRVPVDRTPLPDDGGRWAGPKQAAWPKAGGATLAVAETRRERQLDGDRQSASAVRGLAGGLPVTASAVTGKRVPNQARVELLDEQHSRRLGVSGPVVVVNGDAGTVDAAFDYAEIRQLYGAGWGERLTLKRLPACAATTPQRSECQETDPVKTTNDPATSTLSTRVDLSGAAPMVFAITADESSEEGDYKATDLKASGSWTAETAPERSPTRTRCACRRQRVRCRRCRWTTRHRWSTDGWPAPTIRRRGSATGGSMRRASSSVPMPPARMTATLSPARIRTTRTRRPTTSAGRVTHRTSRSRSTAPTRP